MQVLAIGKMLQNHAVKRAAREEDIEIQFMTSSAARAMTIDDEVEKFDAILVSSDRGDKHSLVDCPLLKRNVPIVPLSVSNIVAGMSSICKDDLEKMNAYFTYGGQKNLRNGFRMLRKIVGEDTDGIDDPQSIPFNAIYTSEGNFYESAEDFFAAEGRQYDVYVGIVNFRNRWLEDDLAVDQAVVEHFNRRGIGTIMAFTTGEIDEKMGACGFEEAIRRFYRVDGKPIVELLVDFQFFALKAKDGLDMFSKSVDFFAELDIPILHPTGLSKKSVEQWKNETRPYAADLSFNFIVPEYQGMIEPIHVHCADEEGRQPIDEQIERLTGRVARWIELRRTENRKKRVAIFLNNAPCSGVEATVGCASDLDAFESAVAILKRMQSEGYDVRNIPADGQALKTLIFERKAFSDFRWTAVEDIAASGGMLYAMGLPEYMGYYNALSQNVRDRMERSWGAAPGEGMVLDEKMIVTGLSFGNVLVMVQPKRGCYGAKCTGEVCKILHDPECPPPHQYLATYWYLSRNWHAQAVIHLGTHGSLEYLPGKNCGLSRECFSDIAIDDLVNLYPFSTAPVAQAVMAKRRGYAVTIGYLPAAGKGLEPWQRELAQNIRSYFEAQEQKSEQAEILRGKIEAQREKSTAIRAVFDRNENFDSACVELRALLEKTDAHRKGSETRTFGAQPNRQWICDFISELWSSDVQTDAFFSQIEDPIERASAVTRIVEAAMEDHSEDIASEWQPLYRDARKIIDGLLSADSEMNALMAALEGRYIRPSRGGDAANGGREILPTGRNLHGGERDKVPTQVAYQRGCDAAEALLALHLKEEGRLPQKVAINMTSLDIVRTGGEQLAQCLHLLGVRPRWNVSGTVIGLECVPLEELGRPRVDVTVRVSSVVRDGWPETLVLMDRAVQLAASQKESEEQNFVRANSKAIAANGEMANGRIFGGKPGTYTSAIGLALKASAWKTEEDLAKYFIDSSSYLYGDGKDGVRATKTFAENIRQVDATCDITSSRRYDAVASSYSARVQGGYRLAAKALGSEKVIRQYMGESSKGKAIRVVPMEEHVAQAISDTLLNDLWQEQIMQDGYSGASELMCRIQNLFDIQCVCDSISDSTIDQITSRYILDADMQRWFRENNPYALEESARRLLELNSRGKWKGDEAVLHALQREYLKAEGDLEDGISGEGDIQAGNVEIVTHEQVDQWNDRMTEINEWMKKCKR